jgi:hypothetical protein
MFYSDTQSFLNFLRILNRLEVGVFARAVKLESPCTYRVYPNSTDKFSGQILRSKISTKLLIHIGSKTFSLRDNQQKPNNYDLNSLDFMGLSVH